jgi:hypothetical protein
LEVFHTQTISQSLFIKILPSLLLLSAIYLGIIIFLIIFFKVKNLVKFKKAFLIITLIFIIIIILLLIISSFSSTGVSHNREEAINDTDSTIDQSLYDLDSHNTITEYNIDIDNEPFKIILIQTEELTPLKPEDEGFSIYKNGYYGEFKLLLLKNELIVDILDLNDCFNLKYIGFIGEFTLVGQDLNNDGIEDYNIGIMGNDDFEFIVFTVKENSFEIFTFDGEEILRRPNPHHSESFLKGSEGELIVTARGEHRFYRKRYFWNGLQFISE